MRQRNGIINRIMKVPKKLYVAAALLLFAGGAGTVLALQPKDEPKQAIVQHIAAIEPQAEDEQNSPADATPTVEQQTQTNAAATTSTAQEESPPSVTDPFVDGSNESYVWGRMQQLGHTIPSNWGNAGSWNSHAVAAGLTVDRVASVGAIAKLGAAKNGVVESVNADGTVLVSDAAGSTITLTAEKASITLYIHF